MVSTIDARIDRSVASSAAASEIGKKPRQPRLSWAQRFRNNWPVVPMRIFLGCLFLFAGYAKFSYPGFFNSSSPVGLEQIVDGVKAGSPIHSVLGTVTERASLFGHIAAGAEIAVGAGLVVGLLTRIAALGGIVLTTLIALSIHWSAIREYTPSSGWFTSVDIAVAVALTTFLLGGPGPLSLDRLIAYLRARQDARDDAEPSFYDSDSADARRRLAVEDDAPTASTPGFDGRAPQDYPTIATPYASAPTYVPAAPQYRGQPGYQPPVTEHATQQLPPAPVAATAPVVTAPAEASSAGNPAAKAVPAGTSPAAVPPAEVPTNPRAVETSGEPTQDYPSAAEELEHDEAAEVEPTPRGEVVDNSRWAQSAGVRGSSPVS